MNFNKLAIIDFETDQSDPNICNPVQLAAVMVNPRTLEFIPDSSFNSYIRPPSFGDEDYIKEHQDTITWHAKTMKKKEEEILQVWSEAPSEKSVFEDFVEYLKRYHTRTKNKNKFSASIACGWNILRFDMIIMERLCQRYGQMDKRDMKIFHPRDKIDGMLLAFTWFEDTELKSYSLENVCNLLGLKNPDAHDGLSDVLTTATIIQKFLRLHRNCGKKVKFKDSCKDVQISQNGV